MADRRIFAVMAFINAARDVKDGYKLTGLFHQTLADFEKEQGPFDAFVKIVFQRLPPAN